MKIIIRTDSSIAIGTGHVMRCLTLADSLQEKDFAVSFICRELPGNVCDNIEKKGFPVYRLPHVDKSGDSPDKSDISGDHTCCLDIAWEADALQTAGVLKKARADWLVVDHYGIDDRWEGKLRSYIKKIMVIDDLADRKHDCDLLLDQNLYKNMNTRYDGLVTPVCQKMLGSQYALLRPEFLSARKNVKKRDGIVKRILIFFGGTDPTSETMKALDAINLLNRPDIAFDVIVGITNPQREEIRSRCESLQNTVFYCQTNNMAEIMSRADMSIGAGGTTVWEQFCTGLPSIIVVTAANQTEVTSCLTDEGLIYYSGWHSHVDAVTLLNDIRYFIDNPGKLREMSSKAFAVVDGAGTPRVIDVLCDRLSSALQDPHSKMERYK